MKSKKPRLDIPGFSYGLKTGEWIDVPKLYGGRPNPKKSGKPHSIDELIKSKGLVSRTRKTAALFAVISKEDYSRRRRIRTRIAHAPVTNNTLPPPCNRRLFEWMGDKAGWLDYTEQPELFVSKSKVAYEITDGLLPMLSTTSSREAMIMCSTLVRYGIAAYFNQVRIPR